MTIPSTEMCPQLLFTFLTGLDTFIKAAQKLPCADLYDVVEGYIKISAECTEILKLLEEENKVESKVSSNRIALHCWLILYPKLNKVD